MHAEGATNHQEREKILAAYRLAANHGLIDRFESIDPREMFAPVSDFLPDTPSRIADIGAGTGRDAAWFARQGHRVLAVEPVTALRVHDHPGIEWLEDCLPELSSALERGAFNLVTLVGVWQHLDEPTRRRSIGNLARMITVNGLLVISIRHGPGADDRRVYPADPGATIQAAVHHGFVLMRRAEAPSVQTLNRVRGVSWTWVVFRKTTVDDPLFPGRL